MNNGEKDAFIEGGLTKREYVATMAMQGILAGYYANPKDELNYDDVAMLSLRNADALLDAISKEQKQ